MKKKRRRKENKKSNKKKILHGVGSMIENQHRTYMYNDNDDDDELTCMHYMCNALCMHHRHIQCLHEGDLALRT